MILDSYKCINLILGVLFLIYRIQTNMYKDDNHKPEMVLVITDFEALCVFTYLAGNFLYNGVVFMIL